MCRPHHHFLRDISAHDQEHFLLRSQGEGNCRLGTPAPHLAWSSQPACLWSPGVTFLQIRCRRRMHPWAEHTAPLLWRGPAAAVEHPRSAGSTFQKVPCWLPATAGQAADSFLALSPREWDQGVAQVPWPSHPPGTGGGLGSHLGTAAHLATLCLMLPFLSLVQLPLALGFHL